MDSGSIQAADESLGANMKMAIFSKAKISGMNEQ